MLPQIAISKNGIRTMKKDIDLLEGKVDLAVNENLDEVKNLAVKAEQEARAKEEFKLKELENQGRKIAEEARRKQEIAVAAKIKAAEEERKREEMERILALRETRKRTEEEERKRLEEEKEVARKQAEAETEKRRQVVARIREAAAAETKAAEEERKKAAAKTRTIQEEVVAKIKTTEIAAKTAEEEKKRLIAEAALIKSPKELLSEEKNRIFKEKNTLREEILEIEKETEVLEDSKKEALSEIDNVEAGFKEIEKEEKDVEDQVATIEEKELLSKTDGERKILEKKRWQLEDKRHSLEKERWPWDEKLQISENALYGIEIQIKKFGEKRNSLIAKEKEISTREQKNFLGLEKIRLEEELKGMDDVKISLEGKMNGLFKTFSEFKGRADKILAEDAEARNKKKLAENAERSAGNLSERKKLEQERWKMEEKIREIESRKWVADEEKKKAANELKIYQDKLKSFGARKEEAQKRLEELKQKLEGKAQIIGKKPEFKPIKVPILQPPVSATQENLNRIEIAKKRIEAMKKTTIIPSALAQNIEMPQDRAKRLEEEKKDVQRMVNEDQQREEIASRIKAPDKTYLSQAPVKAEKETGDMGGLIRIVPKRPGWKDKLWIRLLIIGFVIIILMGILTFWYWYFRIRSQVPNTIQDQQTEWQVVAPAPLFSMEGSAIISLTSENNIYTLLSEYFKKGLIPAKFSQIVIERNGKILELKEFLIELQSGLPQDLLNKLNSSFTLFSYGQGKGRIGFVVKAKEEGLKVAFEKEKKNLEEAFSSLILTSGESKSDVAIVSYASDYYLTITSSSESMAKVIEEMEKLLNQKVLTKDLKIGDKGDSVKLLQTWLAGDTTVYPEHLINSQFGDVTLKAVIRFQEKYKAEILTPQKQTKGTGIVDLLTRKKLNSLYSDF